MGLQKRLQHWFDQYEVLTGVGIESFLLPNTVMTQTQLILNDDTIELNLHPTDNQLQTVLSFTHVLETLGVGFLIDQESVQKDKGNTFGRALTATDPQLLEANKVGVHFSLKEFDTVKYGQKPFKVASVNYRLITLYLKKDSLDLTISLLLHQPDGDGVNTFTGLLDQSLNGQDCKKIFSLFMEKNVTGFSISAVDATNGGFRSTLYPTYAPLQITYTEPFYTIASTNTYLTINKNMLKHGILIKIRPNLYTLKLQLGHQTVNLTFLN